MSQSWIEIIDTALKIGLGSLIAAISGYLVLKKTQDHENRIGLRSHFYQQKEEKKSKYVDFLSQSQGLVQSYLIRACGCDTEEYKNYLRTFNEVQIISSDEVRLPAFNLLSAVNEFIVIEKNGTDRDLDKALRRNVDEKMGVFQKAAQIEVTKGYSEK